MYSQQNVQKTQPEGDFADAWRSHREESRSLHELLLYPVMIHALAAVKGLSCLLDAGCGTGVLTHAAIEILHPQTTLATDLEESLVKEPEVVTLSSRLRTTLRVASQFRVRQWMVFSAAMSSCISK